MNMPLRYLLISSLALSSCAGRYRPPESFESKMARFQPNNANPNRVPEIPVDPRFKISSRGRGPASQGHQSNEDMLKNLPSNKRLYFITLYGQYRHLSQFVEDEKAPEINHCPSFHTTLISYKEGLPPMTKKNLNFENRYQNLHPDSPARYPELSLPMSMDGDTPRLYEVLKSGHHGEAKPEVLVTKALKVHLTKTYKELEELCESGSSENYYNYENLITFINREGQNFSPSRESLKTLLKTTVFSNMTLLESLKKVPTKGRFPASQGGAHDFYQRGMIEKLGVNWTRSYFQSLSQEN